MWKGGFLHVLLSSIFCVNISFVSIDAFVVKDDCSTLLLYRPYISRKNAQWGMDGVRLWSSPDDDESSSLGELQGCNRRAFLDRQMNSLVASSFAGISAAIVRSSSSVANAVVTDNNNNNMFEIGKELTEEQAIRRLKEGMESLEYLAEHYDEICEGGGDNVRRYLGTVGTTSGLFGISKVLKKLSDRADDIVEYTETATEIEKCIQQADGSAYMAIFVTTSTSYTPPSKYFADAKIEIKRCIRTMNDLFTLINLDT